MGTVLRAWAGASVVVALGAGATQCALMPSLDGLSGGENAPDSSPGDATPVDAGSDGGGDGGGSDGGRWCASLSPAPMFCDDFDDQGPLSRWTGEDTRAGATVGRDGTALVSAPNSLLARSPAAVTPSSAYVFLDTTATKSKVRVAYDMRIDARDQNIAYAEINYIAIDSPVLHFRVYMRIGGKPTDNTTITSEVYLADGGIPSHDVVLSGAPRFDTWTRVGVTVDVASTPHTLSVTLDGKLAATQTLEPNLYAPGPVSVRPGIGYTGYPTTSDWRVRYDNVTIDWE